MSQSHPIDLHIGARIRLRRTLLGMSQQKLGDALKLTFQQVQKYERGTNQVGPRKLHRLAQILNVPVSFFFAELPTDGDAPIPAEPLFGSAIDTMVEREHLELIGSYNRLPDNLRQRVRELVRAMAGPIPGAPRRGRPPGSGARQRAEAQAGAFV